MSRSSAAPDAAARLSGLWRAGQQPDVHVFLAEAGDLPPAEVLAALRLDQQQRWRAGQRVPAEDYLGLYPALQADHDMAVELICAEYLLREELGETPTLPEYQHRFPQYADRLRQQIEFHEALKPARPGSTVPDLAHGVGTDWPTIPGYEVLEVAGRGGMGVVYKARQVQLDRLVALKMILAGPYAGPEELARFKAEAEAVARLQHPNIVQIFEVGEHAGRPYFSLEFVDGGTLDGRLADAVLAPTAGAQLVAVLARAMHYAHERGVVHRDLKPANVLLAADGTPKVGDFGLAKRLDLPAGATEAGAVMGTPSYMAPEQAAGRGKEIGPAADVYALGAILYECLTGRPPFRAATAMETLLQVLSLDPLPPSRLQPKVPRDLETICLKCLQKDPARRYASAAELADDLARFLRGEPIRARPVGLLERGVKWARRRPAIAALSGLVVLVAVVAFAVVTWAWQSEALQRQRADAKAVSEGLARAGERKAKEAEELAHGQTKLQKEKAEQSGYRHGIALAHARWLASEVHLAEQALDELPAALRGWEWHLLKRLCHTDLLTFRVDTGPAEPGRGGTFSADGRRYAGGTPDRGVTVWDATTGREVLSLSGPVGTWVLGGDGDTLAVAAAEGVRVWSVGTGRSVALLQGHKGPVHLLALSADGKRLASAGPGLPPREGKLGPELKIWDVAGGRELHDLPGHAGPLTALVLSASGERLASAAAGELRVWDTTSGKELARPTPPSGLKQLLAFSPDGKRLAVLGGVEAVVPPRPWEGKLWDVEDGKEIGPLAGRLGYVAAIAFSRDGSRLAAAVADDGNVVRVWDSKTGSELVQGGRRGYPTSNPAHSTVP